MWIISVLGFARAYCLGVKKGYLTLAARLIFLVVFLVLPTTILAQEIASQLDDSVTGTELGYPPRYLDTPQTLGNGHSGFLGHIYTKGIFSGGSSGLVTSTVYSCSDANYSSDCSYEETTEYTVTPGNNDLHFDYSSELIELDPSRYYFFYLEGAWGFTGKQLSVLGSAATSSYAAGEADRNMSTAGVPIPAYPSGLADLYFRIVRNITYISSNITSDTTWWSGNTYVVSGDIEIDPSVTLTIQKGTIVKFDTATSSRLIVNGTLNVLGKKDFDFINWEPVAFTSINDDNVGTPADVNGNGTSTPSVGDWGGITINSGGEANILGAIIRYAGAGSGAGIYNNGGELVIASSTITHNSEYGIYANGDTDAKWIDIAFQDYGLYVESGSVSVTASSTIHDNSSYGIYNGSLSNVYAQNNYWATSTGPSSLYGSATHGLVDTSNYISQLNFIYPYCDIPTTDTCASVVNRKVFYNADTVYSGELSNSVGMWESQGKVDFIATTTSASKLLITDINLADLASKGEWAEYGSGYPKDSLKLNRYFLDPDSASEREHTISHELGHSLGLVHSFTGNIMFYNQSSQIMLGPQDLFDYHSLYINP